MLLLPQMPHSLRFQETWDHQQTPAYGSMIFSPTNTPYRTVYDNLSSQKQAVIKYFNDTSQTFNVIRQDCKSLKVPIINLSCGKYVVWQCYAVKGRRLKIRSLFPPRWDFSLIFLPSPRNRSPHSLKRRQTCFSHQMMMMLNLLFYESDSDNAHPPRKTCGESKISSLSSSNTLPPHNPCYIWRICDLAGKVGSLIASATLPGSCCHKIDLRGGTLLPWRGGRDTWFDPPPLGRGWRRTPVKAC